MPFLFIRLDSYKNRQYICVVGFYYTTVSFVIGNRIVCITLIKITKVGKGLLFHMGGKGAPHILKCKVQRHY